MHFSGKAYVTWQFELTFLRHNKPYRLYAMLIYHYGTYAERDIFGNYFIDAFLSLSISVLSVSVVKIQDR